MSGVLGMLLGSTRELHRATVTDGDDGTRTGFNSFVGSIDDATFSDASGNSRTINEVTWNGTTIRFGLSAGSVPNTIATFSQLTLVGPGGSVVLNRGDATYSATGGGGGGSLWTWTDSTIPGNGLGQSVTVVVQ